MVSKVTREVCDTLLQESARAHPQECCGILLGKNGSIVAALSARNVHPAPTTHFEIDPQVLIDAHRNARKGGLQVIGYYHSHPAGPPEPSAADRTAAAQDSRIWAIVSRDRIGWWQDTPDGFAPLPLAILDR